MVTVNKKRHVIRFSCDHTGCKRRTERYVGTSWICRQTGRVIRLMRSTTLAYWRKVLANPRRKDSRKFFLLGVHFPDGVTVFCEEHHDEFQADYNSIKRKRMAKVREQEARRYPT